MTALTIYIIEVLDNLNGVFSILFICSSIATIAYIVVGLSETSLETLKHNFKKLSFIWVIIALLASFTPSRTTMYSMVIVPEVIEYINNDAEIKKLPANVVRYANKWFEDNLDKE